MVSRISAKARTSQNIHRHVKAASTAPPTVGPIAGATPITIEIVPIIAPRRWAGTSRITEVITRGIITAVPLAWTTRPASSAPKFGATAHSPVPMAKVVTAVRKIWRGAKRSMRNPVVGITTAMVTKNPETSHCAVPALTFRVLARWGIAIETIVSFKIMMKAATTITPMITVGVGVAWGRGGFWGELTRGKLYACAAQKPSQVDHGRLKFCAGHFIVQAHHIGISQPDQVVGAQDPLMINVNPESLVQRHPHRIRAAPVIGHDDIGAVSAESRPPLAVHRSRRRLPRPQNPFPAPHRVGAWESRAASLAVQNNAQSSHRRVERSGSIPPKPPCASWWFVRKKFRTSGRKCAASKWGPFRADISASRPASFRSLRTTPLTSRAASSTQSEPTVEVVLFMPLSQLWVPDRSPWRPRALQKMRVARSI